MARYLTEFIGTFFLVLTIGLVVMSGIPSGPVAVGSVLMVMVYMGWHVSGAHYNPVVTMVLVVRGDFPLSDVPGYLAAQFLGAGAAAFACAHATISTFALAPGAGVGAGSALLMEVLFTFALVLVILNVAVSPKTKGNDFYGLAIGFVVAGAAFVGGPISGAALNPAVGIMPGLVELSVVGETAAPFWLYVVGPVVGALLAVPVFALQEAAETRRS